MEGVLTDWGSADLGRVFERLVRGLGRAPGSQSVGTPSINRLVR